jgi:hypothetical protein
LTEDTWHSFTFPANQQTNNWTFLSAHWLELRRQWEYSHAASAILYLMALLALILSVLTHREEISLPRRTELER